jgi:hypothetical protein
MLARRARAWALGDELTDLAQGPQFAAIGQRDGIVRRGGCRCQGICALRCSRPTSKKPASREANELRLIDQCQLSKRLVCLAFGPIQSMRLHLIGCFVSGSRFFCAMALALTAGGSTASAQSASNIAQLLDGLVGTAIAQATTR